MKYHAQNRLDLFEFHDAELLLIDFDGADLTVSARFLNVHKDAEQNPFDHDMEIECAQITFRCFRASFYEPGRTWKKGEDGISYPVGPRVVFTGWDAETKIVEELKSKIIVFDFDKLDDGYFIDGVGIEPFFTAGFNFDSVEIEWDDYTGVAWYENR